MSDIGKKIKNRRIELGLTLEDVGQAVGVGRSTVRKWETGMIKNMRGDKISALASVLQMPAVELVPRANEPSGGGIVRVEVPEGTQGKRLYAVDAMPNRFDMSGVYGTTRTTEEIRNAIIPGAMVSGVEEDPALRALMRMWKKSTPERRKKIVRIIKEVCSEDE